MINWEKKKKSLRWSLGCGIFFFIYQIFLENNIFNSKNELWEDIVLSIVSIFPIVIIVFIFYWPIQKTENKNHDN